MSETKKEPTSAEAMLFFSIVKNTRNKADVDWEAVAVEQGFKNAEAAKVRFGQVKRKLGISTDTTATPRSSVVTPKKKLDGGIVKTPSSRSGTKGGKGRSKVKKEEENEDEDPIDTSGFRFGGGNAGGNNKSFQPKEEMEVDADAAGKQLFSEMISQQALNNPF